MVDRRYQVKDQNVQKCRKVGPVYLTPALLALDAILVITATILLTVSRCPTASGSAGYGSSGLSNFFNDTSSLDSQSLEGQPTLNQFKPPSSDSGDSGSNSLSSPYGPSYGSYSPDGGAADDSSGSSVGSDSPSFSNSYGSSSLDGSNYQYQPLPSQSPTTTTTTTTTSSNGNQWNLGNKEPLHSTDTTKFADDIWKNKNFRCGVQSIQPNTRVVGGTVAVKHSWPWAVHLLRMSSVSHRLVPICGATIVSPRHAISALHCFKNDVEYRILIKKHDYSRVPGTEVLVTKVRKHPFGLLEPYYLYYDFVLLTLESELDFGEKVQPACLPGNNVILDSDTMCWAYGWGATEGTGGGGFLKQVKLAIGSPMDCLQSWGTPAAKEWALCAGKETGQDTCQGDSGGPLTCKEKGRWVLYGATSYGGSCGGGKLGVYAAVSFSMKWFCCFLDELPECQNIACDPFDFKYPSRF